MAHLQKREWKVSQVKKRKDTHTNCTQTDNIRCCFVGCPHPGHGWNPCTNSENDWSCTGHVPGDRPCTWGQAMHPGTGHAPGNRPCTWGPARHTQEHWLVPAFRGVGGLGPCQLHLRWSMAKPVLLSIPTQASPGQPRARLALARLTQARLAWASLALAGYPLFT